MKVVLFDFFGVVSPEGHFHTKILREMANNVLDAQVERAYRQLKFNEINEREFWETLGWNDMDARGEMVKRIPIDPKFREVAADLKRKGHVLVLFTDAPRCLMVDELVARHNLKVIFDKIVITPEWGFDKMHPTLYTEAKKEFGDCVLIDDKISVLELANRAGIETIWKKTAEDETSFEPDHIIRYLDEIKAIL